MLGKDYDRKRKREALDAGERSVTGASKPRPPASRKEEDDDEDSEEEGGRSSLGKPRHMKRVARAGKVDSALDGVNEEEISPRRVAPESGGSRALETSNYLDQVLAEKARKRKKKRKKKKKKKKQEVPGNDNPG